MTEGNLKEAGFLHIYACDILENSLRKYSQTKFNIFIYKS